MLELDAGFAGGVCRCSNCGTLMTVPSDAGKAESLTRPTSSASVGAGGLDAMGVPDSGANPGANPGTRRSTGRSNSSKRGKRKKGKSKKGRSISAKIEAGEYRTSSGKVISVDATTRVPMAESKKKQIRMATTIVFFSIIAAVVVVAAIGIIAIVDGSNDDATEVAYNPAANPYTLNYANVMGLPVDGQVAVVVESSQYSAEWMEAVGDMAVASLNKEAKGSQVALIGAGAAPVLLDGGAMRKLPLTPGELSGWFDKLPLEGEADMAAAIKSALDLKPDILIVVVGYADTSDIESWDALVADKEGLAVHAVHIGNSSSELQGWMGDRGGEFVVLSVQDIQTLKEIAAE